MFGSKVGWASLIAVLPLNFAHAQVGGMTGNRVPPADYSQTVGDFDIQILDIRSTGSAITFSFRVLNNTNYDRTIAVFADGRYAGGNGSRIYAGGDVFMPNYVSLGGQYNRYSRYVRVVVPSTISLDGEMRVEGVSIDRSDIKMIEIAISNGYQMPQQRVRFRLR